jgi:hypothetical protein
MEKRLTSIKSVNNLIQQQYQKGYQKIKEIEVEIKEEEFDINGTHDSDDYSHIKSLQ